MPIVSGGKPETHFTDPIDLLTDCHRRRTALETALRYFREAAPKHIADEEESLFPRLRAGRVEALENDHERAVFPLAGAALAPRDRVEIGREMAARRGVKA